MKKLFLPFLLFVFVSAVQASGIQRAGADQGNTAVAQAENAAGNTANAAKQQIEGKSDQTVKQGAELGEIVVTARLVPETIGTVTRNFDILQAGALDNLGITKLQDALHLLPGTTIRSYGGFESLATLSIRGGSPRQTLVLKDGIPVEHDILTGGTDLSTINIDGAEKIEIIRGGMSSVYGPDASAGVINIITGGGEKYWIKAMSSYGTFMSQKNRISSNNNLFGADYFISGDEEQSSGFLGRAYFKRSADLKTSFSAGGLDSKLSGSYMNRSLDTGSDSKQLNEDYDFGADEAYAIQKLNINLTGFTASSDLQYVYNGITRHIKKENQARITAVYNEENLFSAVAGDEFKNNNLESTAMGAKSINENGAFANATANIPGNIILLNAGIRCDAGTGILGVVPGENLSLKIKLPDDLVFGASAENSFSLATVGEKYFPSTVYYDPSHPEYGTFITVPNPDLKPEYCSSYELSFTKKTSNTKETVTWFRRDSTDLIENVTTFSPDYLTMTSKPENVSRARVMGVEAELSAELFDFLGLSGQYTYMEAIDSITWAKLTYEPQVKINLQATASLPFNLHAGVSWEYVDSRELGFGRYLRPYYVVDAHVSQALNNYIKLTADVKNVFDNRDYQVVSGNPMPGRTIMAGAEAVY
jgi:vitamin B12 transporter